MSSSVLVGYATRYGSTQESAEVVAAVLRESGLTVDLQPLRKVKSLAGFQCSGAGCAAVHVPLAQGRAALPVALPERTQRFTGGSFCAWSGNGSL